MVRVFPAGHRDVAVEPVDDVRIVPGTVAGKRSAVNLETVDAVVADGHVR